MKFQESDYNIKKLKQTEIDENFFVSHVNIIEIICQNCKLVFAFNNQLHQHFRLENCKKISPVGVVAERSATWVTCSDREIAAWSGVRIPPRGTSFQPIIRLRARLNEAVVGELLNT